MAMTRVAMLLGLALLLGGTVGQVRGVSAQEKEGRSAATKAAQAVVTAARAAAQGDSSTITRLMKAAARLRPFEKDAHKAFGSLDPVPMGETIEGPPEPPPGQGGPPRSCVRAWR